MEDRMTKLPPVPPQNRSPKGTGDDKAKDPDAKAVQAGRPENPEQQGQQGNTKQNTTHQGLQLNR
jgi:hypothetical protein